MVINQLLPNGGGFFTLRVAIPTHSELSTYQSPLTTHQVMVSLTYFTAGAHPCILPLKGSSESARPPWPAFFNLCSTPKFFWRSLRRILFSPISTATANDMHFKRRSSFC